MLAKSDYQQVYELLVNLAPDFIKSALSAKVAPNLQEKQDYEAKEAYIYAMFETIRTMNNIRFSVNPSKKPNNDNETPRRPTY